MRRRASSAFVGVFTLKTAEQVQALSEAVKRLVENSVGVFEFLETDNNGALSQLFQDLETIVRLSGEFVDLTLSMEESNKAKDVVARMKKAKEGLEDSCVAYKQPRKDKVKDGDKFEKTNDDITRAVQQFLEATADLTDMMELNQHYQGIGKLKQAFHSLQLLANDGNAETDMMAWEAKMNYAKGALDCLCQTLENRCRVSQPEVLEKLRPLTDQIKELTEQFLKEVKAKKCVTAPEVQDPFAKLIKAMREALDLFQSNTLTRKTSFAFDHERVLESLTALENAIQARSAAEVTGYARAVIDQITELKHAAESGASTPRSAEYCQQLSSLTKDVLQATKVALADPSKQPELARSVSALKAHVEAVATLGQAKSVNYGLRQSLLSASQQMSKAMVNLSGSLG